LTFYDLEVSSWDEEALRKTQFEIMSKPRLPSHRFECTRDDVVDQKREKVSALM